MTDHHLPRARPAADGTDEAPTAAVLTEDHRYGWREGDRVFPAYALTHGRTRPEGEAVALESLVTATDFGVRYGTTLQGESQAIVAMSRRPISVAEVAVALHVPLGVARVLVSDLIGGGYLSVAPPVPLDADSGPGRSRETPRPIAGPLIGRTGRPLIS